MKTLKHRPPTLLLCLLIPMLALILNNVSTQAETTPFDFSGVTVEQSGAAGTTLPTAPATQTNDNAPFAFEQAAETATNTDAAPPHGAATTERIGAITLAPATNPPPPDPRTLDQPGWWFQEELRKRSKAYPSFLGAYFAESSRAVIIEVPNRKLAEHQPLVYRLWVCNDLPQNLQCRVEHFVRLDENILATNAPDKTLTVKNGSVQTLGTFKQSPKLLQPGQYIIEANLLDLNGKILHHATATLDVTAK